jgi:hypothetical protein
MATEINSELLLPYREKLETHPVYASVKSIDDLQCFMEHHVYSVWDFMSIIKYLQSIVAPAQYPWNRNGDASVRRFINELVLEEESDEAEVEGQYSSHFDLYLRAMREIGADTTRIERFVDIVAESGIDAALQSDYIPEPSRQFTSQTFAFIEGNKPHEVAAALALGREHIIPCMFRAILKSIGVTDSDAPIFHFYLNRHIHLDEDFHAPLSLRLMNGLCGDDDTLKQEAEQAAIRAIDVRVKLWDGVNEAIHRLPANVARTA